MKNNKWNRKDAELGKEKSLKKLKEENPGWANMYRSEEYFEKELNMLIDEEKSRILKK